MKRGAGALSNLFHLQVNYDLEVEAAVREGQYDWANSDINGKNFQTTRTGQKEVEMKLFHFNRLISSEEAIVEMKKQGYRPAELHEGLAFGAKHKDEQRNYSIVFLGSVWRYWYGDRDVPHLWYDGGRHRLDLLCFDYGWLEDYRFLAVRES